MATGVFSIIPRECVRLAARLGGSRRAMILNALAFVVVSFVLPWLMGIGFVTSLVVIPLACLSVFLVADLAPESFDSPRSVPDTREFVGRAVACVLIGWLCGLAMLFGGLVAMNMMYWEGEWLLPPIMILIDAALLSLASCVFVAGVAVCVGRNSSSARAARLTLKLVMLFSAILLMYGCSRSLASGRLFLTNRKITRIAGMASAFLLANGAALVAYGASSQDSKK
jgi:hypothetical protein